MSQRTRGIERAELWVNAPDEGEYEPLVEHLAHLKAAGDVGEYAVYHWGHDLDVSSDCLRCVEDQLARERVSEFKHWAAEHGCTVLGLGERVTTGVGRMGPEVTVEHLPPVLLAEYVGGNLQRVTPCSAGDEHVSERLERLDTTDLPVDEATEAGESTAVAATTETPTTVTAGAEPRTRDPTTDRSLRARLTRWLR